MLTKTKLVVALATLAMGFATSSFARHGADDPKGDVKGEGAGHPLIQEEQTIARRGRGADDKPGDDRGVHAPGHPLIQDADVVARRGRGKDDPVGHG